MRKVTSILFSFLIMVSYSSILSCCKPKVEHMSTVTEVAIEDLQMNEIVHDSLTDDQLKKIETIYSVLSEVIGSSHEETITNFKRDVHPDREIAIWLEMAEAYHRFTLTHLDLNKRKEAYTLILLRSMMTQEEVMEKANFQFLTDVDAKEIFDYYNPSPQLLTVEKK
jgi:hypothetical protein